MTVCGVVLRMSSYICVSCLLSIWLSWNYPVSSSHQK